MPIGGYLACAHLVKTSDSQPLALGRPLKIRLREIIALEQQQKLIQQQHAGLPASHAG
jgi:hypothetical protein